MGIIDLGKIDGQSYKAIVTIPGWQADKIWERGDTSPSELAKIYSASVWAYACITIRADAIAGIPWEIVPRNDEDSPLPEQNPLVVLLNEVNPEMNGNDLMRATESDLNIYGTAYWEKVRGGRTGKPKGLMRLNPSTMQLKAGASGIQGFIQRLPGATPAERPLDRKDVIYFREYNPSNDLGGLSKLSVAMAAASAGINTSEYTAAFFKNYAIPPIIFSSDQPVDEGTIDKMIVWWNKLFKGVKKQHKAGFTTHGMKPNIIGYPTKDLALKDLMDEIRRDICAVFRVPPAIAGAWEAANYAASQEQQKALYNNALKPHCEYMSGVLEAELFREFQLGLRMKWRFDKLEIMSEDAKTEAERHAILVNAGIEDPAAAADELEVEPKAASQPEPMPFGGNGRGPGSQLGLVGAELRQWERFASNRIKRGQDMREFNTEYIPATLKKSIEGQLEAAKTTQDVTEIMRAAEVWKAYP